jgi:hypothetical protein
MFDIRIDTSDLEARIARLGDDALKKAVAVAVADGAVIPAMAKAPAPSGRRQAFKSAKSRRYFFMALRRGEIVVPYRRTQKIGKTEKQPTGDGADVVVPVSYSDLVRTQGKQAAYFAGVWPTTDVLADQIEADDAERIGTAAVIDLLQQAGLA